LDDNALLALALRAAELLGMEQDEIAEFFVREFDIAGTTQGNLGTCLALAMLIDAEKRLIARGGGRNYRLRFSSQFSSKELATICPWWLSFGCP
jgi:hypothetical protein